MFTSAVANSPNSLMQIIRDYANSCGWTILADLVPDISIDGTTPNDGLRLVIQSPSKETFAHFRSANGKKIFPIQINTGYGIGLTCSGDFTAVPPSGIWCDQPDVCKNSSGQIVGVGIPLLNGTDMNVYLNHITDPAQLIIISVEVYPGVYEHMAVGELQKVGAWNGGSVFSASRNCNTMFNNFNSSASTQLGNGYFFGLNSTANTFVRIDVDSAPLRNPAVKWASAGPNTDAMYTGKQLGLPVMGLDCVNQGWRPKIPHYAYLQSQNVADTGRNCNTLNCITVNMPLAVYILRDPDGLMNFSLIGYIPGVYFISTRNVSSAHTYEISYPTSGQLHQVFPHTKRGGNLGYDGFSIKQETTTATLPNGTNT